MALMKPNDRFYEDRGHVWVSEGLTPIMGSRKNPAPHSGLPVEQYNFETQSSYVIPQGTFVGQTDGMLAPATSSGYTVTYDAQDVSAGVKNLDGTTVSIGGTKTFAPTKPVGVVVWDILQNPACLPNGFQTHLTQTAPTFRTEGVIVLPFVHKKLSSTPTNGMEKYIAALYDFKVGDELAPDFDYNTTVTTSNQDIPSARPGGIRRFLSSEVEIGSSYAGNKNVGSGSTKIKADDSAYRVGRVIAVEADSRFSRQGLQNQRSDEIDVQSEATHGFPRHMWNEFKASRTDKTLRNVYTRKVVFINIDCR